MADAYIKLKKDESLYSISGNLAEWNCLIDFSAGHLLKQSETEIVVGGLLTSKCIGLKNFDDKNFKPEGIKAKLILHNSVYKRWVKGEDGKPKTEDCEPSAMERFFFARLSEYIAKNGHQGSCAAKGFLKFDGISEAVYQSLLEGKRADGKELSSDAVEALSEQFILLYDSQDKFHIPDSEIASLTPKEGGGYGKGSYKSVSEKEKLASRLDFCKEQFPILFETTDGSEFKLESIAMMYVESDEPTKSAINWIMAIMVQG